MQSTRLALPVLVLVASAAALLAQGPPPPPPPPLAPPPAPPANPTTTDKSNLGKALFWDEQLSSNRTVACGTCHVVSQGGSDPRTNAANAASRNPGADGVFGTGDDVLGSPGTSRLDAARNYALDSVFELRPQVGTRKAPSVLNAAYAPEQFWDGRAPGQFRDPLTQIVVLVAGASLESQVLGPPVNTAEMAHAGRDWSAVASQVQASVPLRLSPAVPAALTAWIAGRSYAQIFQDVFGTPGVTPVRIAEAIASYERTLWTGQAPIDDFFGGQPNALTAQELAGQAVFTGPGQCIACHTGNLFTNHGFRYIGVRPAAEDEGRYAVTQVPADHGRMKVPSLRNVELRAPYFRNGEMATLEDVIDFYDRGGDFSEPNLDPAIHPLGLTTQQKSDLAAFLRRPLTDPRVAQGVAPFDHPALFAGSTLAPAQFGHGTRGSAGIMPQIIALEPADVGNAQFRVALERGFGGHAGGLIVGQAALTPGADFFGASLFVDLAAPHQLVRLPALSGSGASAGYGTLTLAIPNDPLLVGVPFYAQWLVFDSIPGVRRFSATAPVSIPRF